jgi:hypothetical protein
MASDSLNFVRVAKLLFAGLPLPKIFDKPWDLIPNGDLWKLFFDHARTKGLHSLRATWVKGHATQQHVRDGVTTEHNKNMNHTADGLADDGVGSYTSNLQPLAQVYCHRQHIYGKIICAIQTHIVCVHMFFKQLRDDKTKELWSLSGQSHTFSATLPSYSSLHCSRQVTVHIVPTSCVAGNVSRFRQVCNFMSQLCLAPLRGKSGDMTLPEHGTSWIELFILFELMGGDDGCEYSPAQPRPNFRQALILFRRIMAHAIQVCLRHGDKDLFAPAKVQLCRLKCVGIDKFVPCINACLHIEAVSHTMLLKALVFHTQQGRL